MRPKKTAQNETSRNYGAFQDGDLPMQCEACGYKGPMKHFLRENTEDTICPVCGERDEHVYEV